MDHEAGVMVCREAGDVYATAEPAAAFHQRTAFCLDIHNEVCPRSCTTSTSSDAVRRLLTALIASCTAGLLGAQP